MLRTKSKSQRRKKAEGGFYFERETQRRLRGHFLACADICDAHPCASACALGPAINNGALESATRPSSRRVASHVFYNSIAQQKIPHVRRPTCTSRPAPFTLEARHRRARSSPPPPPGSELQSYLYPTHLPTPPPPPRRPCCARRPRGVVTSWPSCARGGWASSRPRRRPSGSSSARPGRAPRA